MNRPSSPPSESGRRSLPQRRARERRVLWLGLLISAGLHLLGVALVGDWLAPDRRRAPRRVSPVYAEPPRGMRAVNIVEEPERAPTRPPEEPEPEPERQPEPEPAPQPRTVARTEPAAPADTLSAADRLAPRVVDPRLWEPMVLIPENPTIDEVEARIGAALEMLNDSALAAAEAAVRARDWTVTDDSGGRWGISPGQLHLGKLTIPLPLWFPVSVEAQLENQRWYELDQALERTRILDSFRERVEAIRERRDRQRAEGGGGGRDGG